MLKPSVKIAGILALSGLLLTACGNTANDSAQQESTSTQTSSVTKTSTKNDDNYSQKKTAEDQEFNLIGSFEASSKLSLNFNSDGSYTILRDGKATAGTFRVAAQYDRVLLLKLTQFNEKTPDMDTYVYVTFNIDGSINVGNMGTFKSIGTPKKIESSLYLANYLEDAPETSSDKMVGTWTNKNPDSHVIVTTNYNPDGTFERYSDASGMVTRGNFAVTTDDTKVHVTTTVSGREPAQENFTRNDNFTELTTEEPGISITYVKNVLPAAH